MKHFRPSKAFNKITIALTRRLARSFWFSLPNLTYTNHHLSNCHCFQCREIGYETHEEILRVLHELHTTMKTFQAYQAEARQAETKLRVAEQQRTKLEVANAPPEKLARSKKYKLIEKEVNKVSCFATATLLFFFCTSPPPPSYPC